MKKKFYILLCLLVPILGVFGQNENLALTPPMGWNSWNLFEGEVSEKLLMGIADAMSTNGMKEAGYEYIIIDDYWVGGRDNQNKMFPDPKRFPNGIKYLADYIHSRGLKLGIYSDAAELTCGGVTASYNFEEIDARTFAAWGIDYLKYDYCNAPEDMETAFVRYKKMGDALKKTGRPIVYAICEWGQRKPWLWAKAAGGHLWRTTYDSRDTWETKDKFMMGIMDLFNRNEPLTRFAGPDGWNDPDLLMVGLNGKGKSSSVNGKYKGCTATEYRTHFALWAMMASPLILNFDARTLSPEDASIILNKEIIAIDQDKLGHQATTLLKTDDLQILSRDLEGGNMALCVFNKSDKPVKFNLNLRNDLKIWLPFMVQDIYAKKSLGKATVLKGDLAAHDCVVYKLTAQ